METSKKVLVAVIITVLIAVIAVGAVAIIQYQSFNEQLAMVQAEKGDKGDKGEPGTDGRDGKDGRDGVDETNGINGNSFVVTGDVERIEELPQNPAIGTAYFVGTVTPKDVYCYITKEGSTGWVNQGKLKGEQGDKGQDGVDGKDGIDVNGGEIYYSKIAVPDTGTVSVLDLIPSRFKESPFEGFLFVNLYFSGSNKYELTGYDSVTGATVSLYNVQLQFDYSEAFSTMRKIGFKGFYGGNYFSYNMFTDLLFSRNGGSGVVYAECIYVT